VRLGRLAQVVQPVVQAEEEAEVHLSSQALVVQAAPLELGEEEARPAHLDFVPWVLRT
jgi:hypothetical protein